MAIAVIGAVLEQKVWLETTDPVYTNLYTILVGPPGTGKTRTIRKGVSFLAGVRDFHLAPTSMTMASMVDFLAKSKCFKARLPLGLPPLEYNSITLTPDDWQAFMSEYNKELIAGLTQFYDCWSYRKTRKTDEIDILIPRPQLNIIAGTTRSDLFQFMPLLSWGQGFTSRVILIHSTESFSVNDFDQKSKEPPEEMTQDFAMISELMGEFRPTEEYKQLWWTWYDKKGNNEEPKPKHPKLDTYNQRRKVMLYKLSMIHAIDRGNELVLTAENFHGAMEWLLEAESVMPEIFEGIRTNEGSLLEEIVYAVRRKANGKGMTELTLTRIISNVVPPHYIDHYKRLLVGAGHITVEDGVIYPSEDR